MYKDQSIKLKVYLFLTINCVVLDFVCFVLVLKHFGTPGEEDNEMILIILNSIFAICNIYWVHWTLTLRHRLPEYMSFYLTDGMLGFGSLITKKAKNFGKHAKEGVMQMSKDSMIIG